VALLRKMTCDLRHPVGLRHPVCQTRPLNLSTDWQHTATHCNTLQHSATLCNTLQHTCRSDVGQTMPLPGVSGAIIDTLQLTATHRNTLATRCNTLQHVQHAATHCNRRDLMLERERHRLECLVDRILKSQLIIVILIGN